MCLIMATCNFWRRKKTARTKIGFQILIEVLFSSLIDFCFVRKCKLVSTTRRIIIFFDDNLNKNKFLKLILCRVCWPRSETVIQLSTSPRKTWFLIVIWSLNFCSRSLLMQFMMERNFAFVMFLSMFNSHELFILIIRNFFSKMAQFAETTTHGKINCSR